MRIEIEENGYRWIIERDDKEVRVQMRKSVATAAEVMAQVTRDVGINLVGGGDSWRTCTDPDCAVARVHTRLVCRNLDGSPARCSICGSSQYPHKHPAEPAPGEGYTEYLGPLDLAGPYRAGRMVGGEK